MHSSLPAREGFVPFLGHRVWYRIVGGGENADKLPLLCIQGGPGWTHDYLEPLEAVASTGRHVIFFDLLGTGKSDHPVNHPEWTLALLWNEVHAICDGLGLTRFHLYGHGWGGMLAMEMALGDASHLASLVLADTTASIPQWMVEANQRRTMLPEEIQRTLWKHEDAGTTDDPEYQEAIMMLYRRYFCRVDPFPDCLKRTFDKLRENPQIYEAIRGPSEFHIVGPLHGWEVLEQLGDIQAPTLVVGGKDDLATPGITETIHRGIPGSEWALFENSSHVPHIEEPDRFLAIIADFLTRVEGRGHLTARDKLGTPWGADCPSTIGLL